MPEELKTTDTRPASSDFLQFEQAQKPLDYSIDSNYPMFNLTSAFNPFPSGSNESFAQELFVVSPQIPINATLKKFNEKLEEQQSRYACSYEDPGGVAARGLTSPPRSLRSPPVLEEHIAVFLLHPSHSWPHHIGRPAVIRNTVCNTVRSIEGPPL